MVASRDNSKDSPKRINEFIKVAGEKVNLKIILFLYASEKHLEIKTKKYHLHIVLAGVAQWTECWPVNQKVAGLITGQGTGLGCGPGPRLGACER